MAHGTTPISAILDRVLTRQRRTLLAFWSDAAHGDVRGVHRARVASRRLREALAIAALAGAGEDALRPRRAARRVTRALGPLREIDVALQELDRIALRRGWPDGATGSVHDWLTRARVDRRREMRRQLSDVGRATLRGRIDRAIESLTSRQAPATAPDAVAAYLGRRAAAVIESAALCGTLYSVDRLHALRLAVKKLRYAVETMEPLSGGHARTALRLLKRAQQRLGALHDAQVLLGAVQAMAAEPTTTTPSLPPVLVEDLERECRERHAAVLAHLAPLERGVRDLLRTPTFAPGAGRRPPLKAVPAGGRGRLAASDRPPARRSA